MGSECDITDRRSVAERGIAPAKGIRRPLRTSSSTTAGLFRVGAIDELKPEDFHRLDNNQRDRAVSQ
jgi:hypothetical protein